MGKWTIHHPAVFLLTFSSYAFFHAVRKTLSNVKSTLAEEWTPLDAEESSTTETIQYGPDAVWKRPNFFSSHDSAEEFLGILDASFLFAYATGLYVSGYIADRQDLRIVLSLSMWLTAIAVFLFGPVFEWVQLYSKPAYIVVMIVNGFLQSLAWPSVVAAMGNWFGKGSRGFVLGLWSACQSVGNIIGALLVSLVVDYGYEYAFLLNSCILFASGVVVFFGLVPTPREVGLPVPDEEGAIDVEEVLSLEYIVEEKNDNPVEEKNDNPVEENNDNPEGNKAASPESAPAYRQGQIQGKQPDVEERHPVRKAIQPNAEPCEISNNNIATTNAHTDLKDSDKIEEKNTDNHSPSTTNACHLNEGFTPDSEGKEDLTCKDTILDFNIKKNTGENMSSPATNEAENEGYSNRKHTASEIRPHFTDDEVNDIDSKGIRHKENDAKAAPKTSGRIRYISETKSVTETLTHTGTHRPKAVTFCTALLLPGVIPYSLAYAFLKLVNYSFFFWLPFYLSNAFGWKESKADQLSTWYDVGGIVGGTVAGFISDRLEKRAVVVVPMLVLGIPMLFIYSSVEAGDQMLINAIMLTCTGVLIGGVSNLISAAISADLGRQEAIRGNSEALSTVTGIVDGTGSLGAAIGQVAVPYLQVAFAWRSVFYLFMVAILLTIICVVPIVIGEIKELCRHCTRKRTRSWTTSS